MPSSLLGAKASVCACVLKIVVRRGRTGLLLLPERQLVVVEFFLLFLGRFERFGFAACLFFRCNVSGGVGENFQVFQEIAFGRWGRGRMRTFSGIAAHAAGSRRCGCWCLVLLSFGAGKSWEMRECRGVREVCDRTGKRWRTGEGRCCRCMVLVGVEGFILRR